MLRANCSGHDVYRVPAARGVIAVDPRIIPLGTRVYVDGYGEAVAAMWVRPSKVTRSTFADTHEEALAWESRKRRCISSGNENTSYSQIIRKYGSG